MPVVQHPHHVHPLTPLITYSNEHFTPGNPPPHLPADVDPKTGKPCAWVPRECAVLGPPGGPAGDGGGSLGLAGAVVEELLFLSWVLKRKLYGEASAW